MSTSRFSGIPHTIPVLNGFEECVRVSRPEFLEMDSVPH
jgi:hypothetical protein